MSKPGGQKPAKKPGGKRQAGAEGEGGQLFSVGLVTVSLVAVVGAGFALIQGASYLTAIVVFFGLLIVLLAIFAGLASFGRLFGFLSRTLPAHTWEKPPEAKLPPIPAGLPADSTWVTLEPAIGARMSGGQKRYVLDLLLLADNPATAASIKADMRPVYQSLSQRFQTLFGMGGALLKADDIKQALLEECATVLGPGKVVAIHVAGGRVERSSADAPETFELITAPPPETDRPETPPPSGGETAGRPT